MKVSILILILGLCFCFLICCTGQSKSRVLVSGHRGASGLAPENTTVAILKAAEYNVDLTELDVQETKDGRIILLHDDDLKRTTNDSGVIWEKNWADLQSVDAGSWKGAEFSGEPIPLLTTIIDTVRGKIKLNIEIKINNHQEKIEQRVVNIIEKKDFIDQCVVTSFNRATVEKVKDLNPKIKVGLIFGKMPKEDIFNTRWELLSVRHKLVTKEFVEKAHQANKEVHVWTVDDPKLMKKLISLGVDCIITNRPDILQDVLKQ